MTLIASWVATDDKPEGKSISAVYFCADSRFSWTVIGKTYDMGKKVYACNNYPEIFCFCGDVDFPTTTLQSLIAEIDRGSLFERNSLFELKKRVVMSFIGQALGQYPREVLLQTFSIYHASCIRTEFFMAQYKYDGRNLSMVDLTLPEVSSVVFFDGSGKPLFDDMWKAANKKWINEQFTSRNVYNCFTCAVDAAASHPDSIIKNTVGGVPQLVGLYRKGNTQLFGIIKNDERYIQGRRVSYNPCLNNIEWRNDNFERIDPETMKLLSGAQPQPFAPRERRK